MIFLVLFILFVFNRWNFDYESYSIIYNNSFLKTEFLFRKINDLGNLLSLDYDVFFSIISTVLMLLLLMILKNKKKTMILFLYIIFPFWLDVTQLRNTIMYFIISYLVIKNYSKKTKIIINLIAANFQLLGIIYIPYWFMLKMSRKKFYKCLIILTIFFFLGIEIVITMFGYFFPGELNVYLKNPPKLGYLITWFYIFLELSMIFFIDKKIKKNNFISSEEVENIYRFIFYTIIVLPILTKFLAISRVYTNTLLLKYVYLSVVYKYLPVLYKILIFIFTLIVAISLSLPYFYKGYDIFRIFYDNYIFKLL